MLTLSHSGDDLAKSLGVLTISRTPKEHFSDKVSNSVNISCFFFYFFFFLCCCYCYRVVGGELLSVNIGRVLSLAI